MITSVENARVRDVLRLRTSRERRRSGLFLAEGRREVQRAHAAGLVLRETFVAPELIADWPQPHTAVTARVLAKMAYRAEPEGVLAVVEAPHRELPAHATLLLVAVGIEKPGNLGAMARTADAAGADALLVADAKADPWNPNAIRASTGAVFTLPIVEASREEIEALALQKVAAVVGAQTPYTGPDYTRPTALIVGAEDTGLDARWQATAEVQVSIPMRGATADSLNASTAATVLLYETLRQRDAAH
jgi:TrmH family RNA methyltransferase